MPKSKGQTATAQRRAARARGRAKADRFQGRVCTCPPQRVVVHLPACPKAAR